MSRDTDFTAAASALGLSFDGEIRLGGIYAPVVRDGNTLYVSGQVPRVGEVVAVTGRAGADVPLDEAQRAAKICVLRGLALLRRALGSLDAVRAIPKMNVYVQCSEHFTQHSEVGDAASALLHAIFGEAGAHARTSIGVYQLPKDATVEIDLVACALEGRT
ncbi:RidA family protein [Ramlibacter alkalitolerans]|uniref:RidA family protein n=1 Tax=Ramlibacter alkalitolerans TaxID=2039631 RepID=A0ABS1JPB4_9BURK|nr:RidA family protein [Ramlibacter alkalitolerans]MBL0425981.1 RidA family protein [Ramlibacter alkalitolerans]